jgi:hypothetical protein
VRLGQVIAGVERWVSNSRTVADTGAFLNDRHYLVFCWTPGPLLETEDVIQGILPWQITDALLGGNWTDVENAMTFNDGLEAQGFFPLPAELVTDPLNVYFQFVFPPGGRNGRFSVQYLGRRVDDPLEDPSVVTDHQVTIHHAPSGLSSDDLGEDLNGLPNLIPATFAYGLPWTTDLWNDVELTSDIFNSDEFFAQFAWRRESPTSTTVNIDHFVAVAQVTVPERRVGTLRLSYVNTSDGSTECVTAYNVTLYGDALLGLAAGVQVSSGEWDFDDWSYEYQQSETRPNCGICCTPTTYQCVCCEAAPPESLIISYDGTDYVAEFAFSTPIDGSTYSGGCVWEYDGGDGIFIRAILWPAGAGYCDWLVSFATSRDDVAAFAVYYDDYTAERLFPGCDAFPFTIPIWFGTGPASITVSIPA